MGVRRAVALLALLLAGAAPASAQAPSRQDVIRIASLFGRAERDVRLADRGCRPPDPFGPTTLSGGSPSRPFLRTVGLFRRPQTAEERAVLDDRAPGFAGARGVYRRYVRIAHSASGREFVVLVAQDALPFARRPQRCTRKARERFGELVAAEEPAAFRRRARRFARRAYRAELRAARRGPVEGLFFFDYQDGMTGGGGGGITPAGLRRYGAFGATGSAGRGITVSGLVPDGVATVTVAYRRGRNGAAPIRRTLPVQENVVSFIVQRRIGEALGYRMVWRDADGEAVRTIDRHPDRRSSGHHETAVIR